MEKIQTVNLPRWFKSLFRRLDEINDTKQIYLSPLKNLSEEENSIENTISGFIRNNYMEDQSADYSFGWTKKEDTNVEIFALEQIDKTHEYWIEFFLLDSMGLPQNFILQFIEKMKLFKRKPI